MNCLSRAYIKLLKCPNFYFLFVYQITGNDTVTNDPRPHYPEEQVFSDMFELGPVANT